jgi:hypothetical protein
MVDHDEGSPSWARSIRGRLKKCDGSFLFHFYRDVIESSCSCKTGRGLKGRVSRWQNEGTVSSLGPRRPTPQCQLTLK